VRICIILDVLQNYMTYKAYYELEKVIEARAEHYSPGDPRFFGKAAKWAVKLVAPPYCGFCHS